MREDRQLESKPITITPLDKINPISVETHVDKCIEAIIGRSTSDSPDEVFDIIERYEGTNQTEFRDDDIVERDEQDPYPEEREGGYNRDDGLENYLTDLMGKLNFTDVIPGLQQYPDTDSEERDEFEEIREIHAEETKDLKSSLEKETAKREELSLKLADVITRSQQELLDERTKSSQWAAKLQIQESTYKYQLEQEQTKSKQLEEKIKEMESSSKSEMDIQSNQEEKLKLKIRELETRYQQQLSEEKRRRINSEATLSFQTTKQQYQLDSAQNKLMAIEKTKLQLQELLNTERRKVAVLEEENSQAKNLLELEHKRVKSLLRAEGRRQALLETEHRKVEALEQTRAKMEPIIRRLSKRARILDGAQDQIVRLTKELEKRDSILASVRQTVNVEGLTPFTREEIKKRFSEFSIRFDSTMSQCDQQQSVSPAIENSPGNETLFKSSSDNGKSAEKPTKRSPRGSDSYRVTAASKE